MNVTMQNFATSIQQCVEKKGSSISKTNKFQSGQNCEIQISTNVIVLLHHATNKGYGIDCSPWYTYISQVS